MSKQASIRTPRQPGSEILGHSAFAISLNLYSHALSEMQQQATSALDRLLGSPSVVTHGLM
jgi:hypothetical protein